MLQRVWDCPECSKIFPQLSLDYFHLLSLIIHNSIFCSVLPALPHIQNTFPLLYFLTEELTSGLLKRKPKNTKPWNTQIWHSDNHLIALRSLQFSEADFYEEKKSGGKISSANYPMQSKADLNRCSDVQLYLSFATLVINDYFTNCKWHGTRCSQINQIYGYIQLFLLPEIRSSLNMNTFQRMQRHCIMLMKASLNFQWYSCFYICEGKMQ